MKTRWQPGFGTAIFWYAQSTTSRPPSPTNCQAALFPSKGLSRRVNWPFCTVSRTDLTVSTASRQASSSSGVSLFRSSSKPKFPPRATSARIFTDVTRPVW